MKIQRFRTDNDSVFTSHAGQQYFRTLGIQHETTVPYTPSQNGVSERSIRTAVEHGLAMLETAKALMVFNKVDESLWGEAVRTAIYIANRSPHRAVDGNIPFTKFFGSKPDLSHLRTFGCAAYVHIPKERRSGKFGPHRQLVTFVGYPESQKAWKFFDTSTGKHIIGREATFLELNRFETITMDLGTVNSSHRSETIEDEPPPSRPVKINPMSRLHLQWEQIKQTTVYHLRMVQVLLPKKNKTIPSKTRHPPVKHSLEAINVVRNRPGSSRLVHLDLE